MLLATLALLTAADVSPLRPLRGDAAFLEGASCNVLVVKSDRGLLLIDDQRGGDYPAMHDLLDRTYHLPVVAVVDTHWHLDHAGGNAAFAAAGAEILAQDNVRTRLSTPQYMAAYKAHIPAAPAVAWPRRTYARRMTIRFGGERIALVHVARAHTDGDTLVKLTRANVLHIGDVFMNGYYPFIDLSSGGSIAGLIRAVDTGLRMSDARTVIVPGHGPLADRAALAAYRAMLVAVDRRVRDGIARGESLDAIIAQKPAAAYRLEGDADRFVAAVHAGHAPLPTP